MWTPFKIVALFCVVCLALIFVVPPWSDVKGNLIGWAPIWSPPVGASINGVVLLFEVVIFGVIGRSLVRVLRE